jgi:hypothetical protein
VAEALAGAFGGRLTAEQRDRLVSYAPDGRVACAAIRGIAHLGRGKRTAREVVSAIAANVRAAESPPGE